jgi:endo-1,4-beta-D-glucanase Y
MKASEGLAAASDRDGDLLWALRMAGGIVKRAGRELLAYKSHIRAILDSVLCLSSHLLISLGSKFFKHVCVALTDSYRTLNLFQLLACLSPWS